MNSENHKEKFIDAIIKFQSMVKPIVKTSVNPFLRKGQNDGKYASYQDIISGIRPHMKECGLAIMHLPQESENGTVKVLTTIYHSSGESISSTLVIPCDLTSQAYGSAITYAKRYQTSAMLGLSIGGEDDDGQSANKNKENSTLEIDRQISKLPDDIKEMLKKKGITDKIKAHQACMKYDYDHAKIRTALSIALNVEA